MVAHNCADKAGRKAVEPLHISLRLRASHRRLRCRGHKVCRPPFACCDERWLDNRPPALRNGDHIVNRGYCCLYTVRAWISRSDRRPAGSRSSNERGWKRLVSVGVGKSQREQILHTGAEVYRRRIQEGTGARQRLSCRHDNSGVVYFATTGSGSLWPLPTIASKIQ